MRDQLRMHELDCLDELLIMLINKVCSGCALNVECGRNTEVAGGLARLL